MALHVIVPARYGSTRFPGKPLVDIGGRPMIQHVVERAAQAKGVKTVAVATDDERIAQAVKAFGGRVIMTPPELPTGSDRVARAAQEMGLGDEEMVVNVQGDQPLLPSAVIELLAQALNEEKGLGMATPVVPITRPEEVNDPNHVKVALARNHDALYFSRQAIPYSRQGEPVTYYKHLGVYIFRKAFLDVFTRLPQGNLEGLEKLKQLRVLEAGHRLRCVITSFDSPEVDRPEDAKRVAQLMGLVG